MALKYTHITSCLACGGKHLTKFLDLGKQPLANSYVKQPQEENTYPLELQYCEECTHVQLTVSVDPDELFKNYIYVSGTTSTGKQHFSDFVDITETYVPKITNVLDIACNDGSQLEFYKQKGYSTFGIDPAENLLDLSSNHGTIICDYLTADNIKSFGVEFDVIIAQNVFAHLTYTKDFLKYSASCLSDAGAIFIQTSQANMIFNGEFDTVYHEHLSFFSPRSMQALARSAGLVLVDIQMPSIHGTSYIFVLRKHGTEMYLDQFPEVTKQVVEKFSAKVSAVTSAVVAMVDSLKASGYTVVGYGAAAKSNTFLNYSKISLDYIVEDNALKQGLLTPGTNIPIVSPTHLVNDTRPLVVVPLAWNFYSEIKQKVLAICKSATMLRYYPSILLD
jgi:2-polyprenyl-3-methyl-5-hydroxy-6-metoxy-1,4-benzoquinol methylase